MNNKWTQKLKKSLQTQDWDSFRNIRYTFGQEGSVFYIQNLDLSHAQLGGIPSSFLCFYNCNLTGASFRGKKFFPVALWKCQAQKLDLRGGHGMLFAFQSDLRAAQFDATTILSTPNSDLPSAFEQCQLDEAFKIFIKAQGVSLHFSPEKHIPMYAYEVPPHLEEKFLSGELTVAKLE